MSDQTSVPRPPSSGQLALDVGQTGSRLRWVQGRDSLEAEAAGARTDQPLMPQLAEIVTGFLDNYQVDVHALGVGCTGVVDPEAHELLGLLSGTGIDEVVVAHDSTTNYLGALGDNPGVVVASGTGVVTLALGDRTVARVDGWGYLLGDAGSAYWIGRKGLEAAMRAYDGRGTLTALSAVMEQDFDDVEAAYIELQSDPWKVSRIAGYAKVVDRLAETDTVAAEIIDSAAAELSESALAGLRRVDLMGSEPPAVCALGKVLQSSRIRRRFLEFLRMQWPDLELRQPMGNSLRGAGLLLDLGEDSPMSTRVARASR